MGLERLPWRGHARTMQGSKGCLVCATGLNPSWAIDRVHQEHFGNTGLPLGAATAQDDTCTCCSDLQQRNNKNGGFILHVLENVRPFIPRLLSFFKVEISSRTLIHSLCQDQSTVAQRAKTTVAKCFLTSCV